MVFCAKQDPRPWRSPIKFGYGQALLAGVEPLEKRVGRGITAALLQQCHVMSLAEAGRNHSGDAGVNTIVQLRNQIASTEAGHQVGSQQYQLTALAITDHKRARSSQPLQMFLCTLSPNSDAVGDAVQACHLLAQLAGARVKVERDDARSREPERESNRIVALGTADIHDLVI